jgi:hypothetical protein
MNRATLNFCLAVAALALSSCGTVTFNKPESDARIENLRTMHLALVDQFPVSGKKFDAAAFDRKVEEVNKKFDDALLKENIAARRPVIRDLANQFRKDAEHLRSKAIAKKITPSLASDMKQSINKDYDRALGK